MIDVCVTVNRKSSFQRLRVEGHAGFSKMGTDIVCAGVSAITDTLGISLHGLLDLDCVRISENGIYEIVLGSEQVSEQTDLLFSAFILGINSISEQFPDRLRFHIEEMSENENPEG